MGCLHDPANVQQTSSKLWAIHNVFYSFGGVFCYCHFLKKSSYRQLNLKTVLCDCFWHTFSSFVSSVLFMPISPILCIKTIFCINDMMLCSQMLGLLVTYFLLVIQMTSPSPDAATSYDATTSPAKSDIETN